MVLIIASREMKLCIIKQEVVKVSLNVNKVPISGLSALYYFFIEMYIII